MTFCYKKRVAYFETDAMGVVHHSNYVRYFEEARVEWLRAKNLIDIHTPRGPFTFAVVDLAATYLKSARFDDELSIFVRPKLTGVRIHFDYAIWCERMSAWITTGRTDLVALNETLKPSRLPKAVIDVFRENEAPPNAPWPPELAGESKVHIS